MSDPKPSLSIMLVDDNRDTVRMLAFILERALGFKVRVATSGKEALEALAEFTPDVFVIDISMPVMSGLELAQRLRESPAGRSALLIALSGWAGPTDAEASLVAGFDRHLAKPVESSVLVSTIRTWEAGQRG